MVIKLVLNCILLFFITTLNSVPRLEEQKILKDALAENQPIVAVFLSPNCPWSAKLQQEVVESPLFLDKIRNEALLWPLFLEQREEEKTFLEKYHVQKCPTLLLLDPKGKEFARFEYVPLDAAGYGEMILSQIESFNQICIALAQNDDHFDEEKWRELYQKAKKLSAPCFKQVLLERGFRKEKGSYFHLEKFASLLDKYKIRHPLVRKAKKQLLDRDRENEQGFQFKVAVLEFQKLASRLKSKDRPEKALRPLLKYAQAFEKKDRENYWKSEWMIAEFLYTKNSLIPALEHAKAAYLAAPDSEKQQIGETISFFERQLKKI
jgi:hypothetical protein